MEAFFLEPANRDFAEGKGRYQPSDLMPGARVTRTLSRFLMIGGVLATLGAGVFYLYQEQEHEELLASVKTVTAHVRGCEGPGRYEHIRFRYAVDGKMYDQSAYAQQREFRGPSTLIDACKAMTVELNYLPSNPNRWSAAPISPLSRDEREAKPNADMFIPGPMLFALGGLSAFISLRLRKQMAKQDALNARGIVLQGELLRMEEIEVGSIDVICYYQFKNPAGVLMNGKSENRRPDLSKDNYPPPGTPVYVIYATDQIFEIL
jgi:hypothetical protein